MNANKKYGKRLLLRKKLNKKTPCKLYAYIYRAHITKKDILKMLELTMSKEYFRKFKYMTMMEMCNYNKDDVIEAIVDIKVGYGRMILC
mgnify:CR=1 FL=1